MKIKSEGKTEFERFDDVIGSLLSVPHEKVKRALDKEVEEKKKKQKKPTSCASRVANGKD